MPDVNDSMGGLDGYTDPSGPVCPDCYSTVKSLEHDGRCARCAGIPAPTRTRYAFLKAQADTLAVAIERTETSAPRRAAIYRESLERVNRLLERLDDETGQRP